MEKMAALGFISYKYMFFGESQQIYLSIQNIHLTVNATILFYFIIVFVSFFFRYHSHVDGIQSHCMISIHYLKIIH